MTTGWTSQDIPNQSGKIAVVTGANSGLGLETSAALAGAGATVVMACRDATKARTAFEEVRRRAPSATIEIMPLDLADLASVRQFAQTLAAKYPRLDLLVNNAGVMAVPMRRTRDGFEMQIGTNHFGHYALTGLLLEPLKAAPAARVVNVASLAHRWTRAMDLADINWEHKPYKRWDAYGKSKLANLLFTFELDRRLKQAGLDVITAASHPGYAATNLQFVGPSMDNSAVSGAAMKLVNVLFGQSSAMGALPSLYAATAADVQSGDYYGPAGFQQLHGAPVKVDCRKLARDPQLAAQLWALSAQLTGVQYL
ncbi:MAG: family NAD(P)-dependent oxidoreductase [Nevskia sp.]|nr:family NAD(P)-dependent oxidoreductase [Nevskia sp.]